ncbi:DUF5776 domain-containing protein [Secundilactobacillus oryzae]|uniref:DUF5776 domain-containing protein n=1 Tax=Secundilactobacillus oryzae TaxID=1202668 RepID=UPI000AF3DC83
MKDSGLVRIKLVICLLKKGVAMRVKRIVTVGSVTRFQLTNGHYVTANRLFVTATK